MIKLFTRLSQRKRIALSIWATNLILVAALLAFALR